MKKLYCIFGILGLAAILFSCSKIDEPNDTTPCNQVKVDIPWVNDSVNLLKDSVRLGLYYYLDFSSFGDSANVLFSYDLTNICGNSEPEVTWITKILSKNNSAFTVFFHADWAPLFGISETATSISEYPVYSYSYVTKIGLTQIYGGKAGEIIASINYRFPTRGSRAKDLEFLRSSVAMMEIEIPYYPFN